MEGIIHDPHAIQMTQDNPQRFQHFRAFPWAQGLQPLQALRV